jgi:DNA-directed RNA polymerase subunit M/transcription elongation factor TFIIS
MENRAEILFDEGISAYEDENLEMAESKFIEALEINPLSEEIKYNLALVYLETKQYDLCNRLIAGIYELDCGEIIDELEKADTDEPVSIPESIPNRCANCFYFTQDSLINEIAGFCTFYHIDVKSSASCHVYKLVDEGKVTIEEIKENLNKSSKENAVAYMEQLNEQKLMDNVFCDSCGAAIKLNNDERENMIFHCSSCKTTFNIKKAMADLEENFKSKKNDELFEILIDSQDFRIEYLFAAREEIKKRTIDLKNDEEFLNRLDR